MNDVLLPTHEPVSLSFPSTLTPDENARPPGQPKHTQASHAVLTIRSPSRRLLEFVPRDHLVDPVLPETSMGVA